MKLVYLVLHESATNYPKTLVSVWDDEKEAERERDRLNQLEKSYRHLLGRYIVEEVLLNSPGTVPLN